MIDYQNVLAHSRHKKVSWKTLATTRSNFLWFWCMSYLGWCVPVRTPFRRLLQWMDHSQRGLQWNPYVRDQWIDNVWLSWICAWWKTLVTILERSPRLLLWMASQYWEDRLSVARHDCAQQTQTPWARSVFWRSSPPRQRLHQIEEAACPATQFHLKSGVYDCGSN